MVREGGLNRPFLFSMIVIPFLKAELTETWMLSGLRSNGQWDNLSCSSIGKLLILAKNAGPSS